MRLWGSMRGILHALLSAKPDVVIIVTPGSISPQEMEALSRVKKFLNLVSAYKQIELRQVPVDVDKIWHCVGSVISELLSVSPSQIHVSIGPAQTSLNTCLVMLSMLLAFDGCLSDRVREIRVWSESANRPIEISMAPIAAYRGLIDAKSIKRKEILEGANNGGLRIRGDGVAREAAKFLNEHGLVSVLDEGSDEVVKVTEAGASFAKLLGFRKFAGCP